MNTVQILALIGGIAGYIVGFIGIRLYFRFKEQREIEEVIRNNPYIYYGFAKKENEDK